MNVAPSRETAGELLLGKLMVKDERKEEGKKQLKML